CGKMTSIGFMLPSTSCCWLQAPCQQNSRCHGYSGEAQRIVAGRGLRPGVRSSDVLQTFGSAGAGKRRKCLSATNIRLRWSRVATEMPACYKHSAPLEPGGDGNACVLQTFGSAG